MNRKYLLPLMVAATSVCYQAPLTHAGTVAIGGSETKLLPTSSAAGNWDVNFSSGLSLSKGNSDNLAINAALLAERLTDVDEWRVGLVGTYAETDGVASAERVYAAAQYNKLLSDRLYLGLLTDALYDGSAQIDYRIGVHPVLGYYAIKSDTVSLAFEAGPSYIFEDVAGVEDNYLGLHVGERLTIQLTERSKLWQSINFIPRADDFDDYLLSAELGIDTKISSNLSFRAFVRDTYDSTPGAGLEKNDLGLFVGLSYALNHVGEEIGEKTAIEKATAEIDAVNKSLDARNAAPPTTEDWVVTFANGLSLTDGNSDTLTAHSEFTADRAWSSNEIHLKAGGAYGETGGEVNTQEAYASAGYNYLLTDKLYVGERIDFRYNDISDLDYFISPTILLGTYLVKNNRTSLAIEAGPGYAFEKQGGIESNYATVYAGERFTHKLNSNMVIWQSVGFTVSVEDTDDYMLTSEVGADLRIGGGWSMRVAAQDVYDNTPGGGADKNDLRVLAGLAYTF